MANTITLANGKITVFEGGMTRQTQETDFNYTHTHKAYELFASFEACSIVTPDGEKTEESRFMLIPPHFRHYCKRSGKKYTLLFQVSAEIAPLFPRERKLFVYPFSDKMKLYLEELESTFLLDNPVNTQKKNTLYTLFFLELTALTSTSSSPVYQDREQSYEKIISNVLNTEYTEEIHLDYIAEKLHLSTKQTTRVIQKIYNRTLPQLLLHKRLGVAAQYLYQTDLKIVEIMTLSGFTTENYFFSVFKKQYGLTPRAYRAKMKQL